MRQHIPWVLVMAALVGGCGTEPAVDGTASAIIRGSTATPATVGATVALVEPGTTTVLGSGTLVAPNVVVTVAHRILTTDPSDPTTYVPLAPSQVNVVVGAVDVSAAAPSQIHQVRTVWIEPTFLTLYDSANTDWRDIGALVLADSVTTVAPAPILDPSQLDVELTPSRMLRVAGYGTTDPSRMRTDFGIDHEAQVPFISRTDDEITAGDTGGADTCYMDGGGPLYVDTADGTRLVGATVKGVTDGPCGSGTIFTLIPFFRSEIEVALSVSLASPRAARASRPTRGRWTTGACLPSARSTAGRRMPWTRTQGRPPRRATSAAAPMPTWCRAPTRCRPPTRARQQTSARARLQAGVGRPQAHSSPHCWSPSSCFGPAGVAAPRGEPLAGARKRWRATTCPAERRALVPQSESRA